MKLNTKVITNDLKRLINILLDCLLISIVVSIPTKLIYDYLISSNTDSPSYCLLMAVLWPCYCLIIYAFEEKIFGWKNTLLPITAPIRYIAEAILAIINRYLE